jgi:hypothetical protein
VTCFYAILDPKRATLRYANAGAEGTESGMGKEGRLGAGKTPDRGSPSGCLDARTKILRMSHEEGVELLGCASLINTTVLDRRS